MQQWKNIKAFTLDIDGVMTDGNMQTTADCRILRTVNAKDTFALRAAVYKGLKVAVFTGGHGEDLFWRLQTVNIAPEDIHLRCRGKIEYFNEFCERYSLDPSEVAYIGDDMVDIPVIKAAGIGIAPADAAVDVINACDYLCENPGGRGCVREVVEKILRAKGLWNFDLEDCKNLY